MKVLNNCFNKRGLLDEKTKNKIKRYFTEPSLKNWSDICIITIYVISDRPVAIWEAVKIIDPTFPIAKTTEDRQWVIVDDWDRIPEPFLVLRAIHNLVG